MPQWFVLLLLLILLWERLTDKRDLMVATPVLAFVRPDEDKKHLQ